MTTPLDPVPSLAQRYALPEEVVRRLHRSMQISGGANCDFDIPQLGGPGQWTPGLVSGPASRNHSDRMRIDGLCCELAAMLRGSDTAAPAALAGTAHGPSVVGSVNLPAGPSWWPAMYGEPAAQGEHCGVRFAFFPHLRRLLIQRSAHIDAYDTGPYAIEGIAAAQGQVPSLTFASNRGPVRLEQLACVKMA